MKRPQQRHHGSQNKNFERWWDMTTRICARNFAIVIGGRAQDYRRQSEALTVLKSHRKRTYRWLKGCLSIAPPDDPLLDIMAGLGHSTVPLVLDMAIDRLILLEAMGMFSCAFKAAALRQDLRTKMLLMEEMIGPSTPENSLPQARNASLISTGLVFEENDRAGSSADMNQSLAGSRGHILKDPGNPVSLEDVLRGLSGSERILHIADAPRPGITDGVRRSRECLERILTNHGNWKIIEWKKDNQSELVVGKLGLK